MVALYDLFHRRIILLFFRSLGSGTDKALIVAIKDMKSKALILQPVEKYLKNIEILRLENIFQFFTTRLTWFPIEVSLKRNWVRNIGRNQNQVLTVQKKGWHSAQFDPISYKILSN